MKYNYIILIFISILFNLIIATDIDISNNKLVVQDGSSSGGSISIQCLTDLMAMEKLKYPDSIEMIMFSGKTLDDLGNIDMCLYLASNVSQYCVAQADLDGQSFIPGLIGLCLPVSCSESDVAMGLETLEMYAHLNISLVNLVIHCYSDDNRTYKPMTTGNIVMIVVCSFFGLLVVLGTGVEYYLYLQSAQYKRMGDQDGQKEWSSLINEKDETSPPSYEMDYNSKSIPIRVLMSFSLIQNYRSFINISSTSRRRFDVLDGVRTMSMCWVVLGHSLLFVANLGYDNVYYMYFILRKSFFFQIVSAGEFAVDTFFMLSGFLVAHALLGQFERDRSQLSSVKFWIKYLVHRFVRLSPLLYFVFFLFWQLSAQFGSGPLWFMYPMVFNGCQNYWWTNLLYINTLYPPTMATECFGWGWYLGDDMLFYIFVAPITVALFLKSRKLGIATVIAWLALTFFSNLAATLHYDLPTFFEFSQSPNTFFADIYQKPWNRVGAYAVGVAIAFINSDKSLMRVIREKIVIRIVYYVLAFGLTLYFSIITLTYYHDSNGWSKVENALYNGSAHTGFVIGVALFLLQAFTGNGGIVRWFFELPIFKYFSKLTYSAYLVHPIVIWGVAFSHTTLFHFDYLNFLLFTISVLCFTFIVAFTVHMTIEKPFNNIEKIIFQSNNNNNQSNQRS